MGVFGICQFRLRDEGEIGIIGRMYPGYRVGRQLVERYTADRARLGETLDVIKFICKEFWYEVFHKQVSLP